MAIGWILYRDRILVDQDFADELDKELAFHKPAPGTTLALVARSVIHAPGFPFTAPSGHPLVVITEAYDGNGGSIDTSGAKGVDGAKGAGGKDNALHPGVDGGDGGNGAKGAAGGPASALALYALNAKDVRLIARGGTGGAGGAGGTGGRGGKGVPQHGDKLDGIEPGDGGDGGDGGPGAKGGAGALVTFRSLKPAGLQAAAQLFGNGGAGGKGGAAGKGGSPGMESDVGSAKPGKPGSAGAGAAAGATVAPQQFWYTRNTQWWSDVGAVLGVRSSDWAAYRERVGEYCFRRHQPYVASRISWRHRAVAEFAAVERLDPERAAGSAMRAFLVRGLNPLGLTYEHHPVPDFERFEQVAVDYGPMVQNMYGVATDLLIAAADVADNTGRIAGEIAKAQAEQGVLSTEKNQAVAGLAQSHQQLQLAQTRLEANQARIDAVLDEMQEAQGTLQEQILGSVAAIAIAVVSIAGAVVSGGSSLAGLAATVGLFLDVERAAQEGAVDEYGNLAGSLGNDFNAWVNVKKPGGPDLTKDAEKFVGSLKDLINKAKAFYDKVQTVKDLFELEVNSELEEEYRQLLVTQVELGMARNLAEFQMSQAGLEVTAADQRIDRAAGDVAALQAGQQKISASIAKLSLIARTLISRAQTYADVLMKYWFLAACAVDDWTASTQWRRSFSFAFGHLMPDKEEDAYQAARRGDPASVLELLSSYSDSWSQLPQTLLLRDDFESHQAQLEAHREITAVTDPAQLESFRKNGVLLITVPDLPVVQSAAKVFAAFLAFDGATADVPTVEAELTHPGSRLAAGPAGAPIQCTFDAADKRPLPEDVLPSYWGRNPSATWLIQLDPSAAITAALDLTGLKAVTLTLDYLSL